MNIQSAIKQITGNLNITPPPRPAVLLRFCGPSNESGTIRMPSTTRLLYCLKAPFPIKE
jgi:hypothetical protein